MQSNIERRLQGIEMENRTLAVRFAVAATVAVVLGVGIGIAPLEWNAWAKCDGARHEQGMMP